MTWSVAKRPRAAEQCDVNIHSPRDVLGHGPTCPGPRASTWVEASFRSRLCLNKIMNRIILMFSNSRAYSPRNREFHTASQPSNVARLHYHVVTVVHV
ncbi:hypothetical protein TNCV_1781711 [Trichonephila clavipes]|nr:hypothetical protein TNCV_1781711 [Trichonephila clavipes]